MKVWIVWLWDYDAGIDNILGVFSSEEKAKAAIPDLTVSWKQVDVKDIEIFEKEVQ